MPAEIADPILERPSDATVTAALARLADRFGARISTAEAVREQHGRDESYHAAAMPDAVVFATSRGDVEAVVAVCAEHGVPIVPFGTGTSLEGHVAALRGGISLDCSGMDQILAINVEDMDAVVQPGVTRKQLNAALRDQGLFFPIDPGADASIGGMASTRASGTNAVRYGTMRETVLALEVVLADGRVIRTGGRSRKSAAGYDLTRLFVGSEGTLGVITEITLRLHGVPEAITAAMCPFPTLEGAVRTVIETIQMGVPVARIELLDEVQVEAVNAYSRTDYPVSPMLLFEFHGTEAGAAEQAEMVQAVAAEHGGAAFAWAAKAEERSRLWQARHDAFYACKARHPGWKHMATDVCVPISRLAECILETRRDIDGSGLYAPIVGHVGDGNFHLVLGWPPEDAEALAAVRRVNDRMVTRALAMGGTCTGEHGIGYGKIGFLEREHGAGVSVMRDLKRALDPRGLFNPGKIVRP